jgi:hypothetical protein
MSFLKSGSEVAWGQEGLERKEMTLLSLVSCSWALSDQGIVGVGAVAVLAVKVDNW